VTRAGTGGAPAGPGRAGSGADLRAFRAADTDAEAGPLMQSLIRAKELPGLRAAEAGMLAELGLGRVQFALDVGCGLGDGAVAMLGRMPSGGRVAGVDTSQAMIAAARRQATSSRLSFAVATAACLPFPAGCFGACRAESVLQHVPDPAQVVAEMARVTRPGGRIACFEFDLGLTVVDHPDKALTRKILDSVADAALDGWVGRQVPRLLRRAGFTGVRVQARTIFAGFPFFRFGMRRPLAQLVADGVISGRDAVRWLADLEQADRAGEYLGGSTAFLVSASRR